MDLLNHLNQVSQEEQREVCEDRERQSVTISSDHHRHAHSQPWWQHIFFRLGLSRPKDLPPLPVTMQTGASSSQALPSEDGLPLGTLDPNLYHLLTRRMRAPEHQTTKIKTAQNRVTKVVDMPEERHNIRKMEILETLAPLINSDQADHSFVLLCWGKPNHCHIIPVKVSNSVDNMTIWQEIRRGWYASRGSWRKYMLLDVSQVRIVNILIAGRELRSNHRSKPKHGFVGTYAAEKVDAERELERISASYYPQEFPCTYDSSTGQMNCFDDCISTAMPEYSELCPKKILLRAERKFLRSKMRPFLTLAFSDPSIGMVNDLLDGEEVIIGNLDLLSKLNARHYPSLGELHFQGLLICEDWRSNSSRLLLSLITTAFTLMVLGAKLIYDDWGIAWNVGCYLVSMASLLIGITAIMRCQT